MKGWFFRARSISPFNLIKLLLSATNYFYFHEVGNLFQSQGSFAYPWQKKFQDSDSSSSDHTIKTQCAFSSPAAILRAVLSGLATPITQILGIDRRWLTQFDSKFLHLILEKRANCNFFATFINYTMQEWFTKPWLPTLATLPIEKTRR